MEVKDILGLSEPMGKLIDVFSNGISALSAPWMYKRMERAKAQMLLENSNQNREIALKDALAEQLKDDLLTGRDKREMNNIADVIGLSAELVNALPKVSEEPVNPDWAARFFDYVKNCSDDDVKQIWSRILAGEVKTPGSYSYRTLDALRNMTKYDAELLVKYADRVVLGGLLSHDIPVMELTHFAEAGFLNETHLNRYLDIEANDSIIVYSNNDYLILASNAGAKKRLQCDFHALTLVGKELYPLVSIGNNRETAMKICEQCKHNFHSSDFSLHRIFEKNGNTYRYSTIPEK